MKTQKLYALSIGFVLLLSMVGIVSTQASPMFFSDQSLNYTESPTVIEAANVDSLNQQATALPTIQPYWADLVDTENVDNTGENVYVAVLDTGLLSNWASLFSEATIRDDLGMGFSHDIYWDNDLGLVVGPVQSDRGFITNLASGHGTHVTSTIVGYDIGGVWINGVAPNVQIIPVLVLDAWLVDTPSGQMTFSGGTDAMIVSGLLYIASLASQLDGRVVINMSLGGSNPSPAIHAAIQYAISQGVIVVASAGNEGSTGMGYPGAFPEVISVAAAGWATMFGYGWTADAPENLKSKDAIGNNHQLYLEDFSSRPNITLDQKHQDLDVAAPGAWIVGPYKSAFANNFGYYYLSGTSMAAPHVSAIAALVLESYPHLQQGEMETILKLAARGSPLPASDAIVIFPYTEAGYYTATWDGGDYGAGFLQADAALSTAAIHA